MKALLFSLTCLLPVLLTATSCRNKDNTSPCSYPRQLTIDSTCYAGNGVALTATDYGDSPLSFEWDIYALKDTTKILGWSPNDLKIRMIASNKFIVPDSLVTNYQRLIVEVATNCQGDLKHSIVYGFIKKKSTASSCITWTSQNN